MLTEKQAKNIANAILAKGIIIGGQVDLQRALEMTNEALMTSMEMLIKAFGEQTTKRFFYITYTHQPGRFGWRTYWTDGEYPNLKTINADGTIVITNIMELTEQDYNDFVKQEA